METCRFCNIDVIKSNPKLNNLTAQLIQYHYSDTFYFYLTKSINDILNEKLNKEVVRFHHEEFDDPYDNGYLERAYRGKRLEIELKEIVKDETDFREYLNFTYLNVWKIFQDRDRYRYRLMRIERSMNKNKGKLLRQPYRTNGILKSLEKVGLENTFETKVHDIYDPEYSSMIERASGYFAINKDLNQSELSLNATSKLKSLLQSQITEQNQPFNPRISSISNLTDRSNIFSIDQTENFEEENHKLTLTQKLEGIMNSLNERSTRDFIQKNYERKKERSELNAKIKKKFFFKKTPERQGENFFFKGHPYHSLENRKALRKFIMSEISKKSSNKKKNDSCKIKFKNEIIHQTINIGDYKTPEKSVTGKTKVSSSKQKIGDLSQSPMNKNDGLFKKKITGKRYSPSREESIYESKMMKTNPIMSVYSPIGGARLQTLQNLSAKEKNIRRIVKSKAKILKNIKSYEESKDDGSSRIRKLFWKTKKSSMKLMKPNSSKSICKKSKYFKSKKSPSLAEVKRSILKTDTGFRSKTKSKSRDKSRISQNLSVSKKSPLLKRDFKILYSVSPQKKISFSNLKNSIKYSTNFRKLSVISKNKSILKSKKEKSISKIIGLSNCKRSFAPGRSTARKFISSLAKSWDPKARKRSKDKKTNIIGNTKTFVKNLRSSSQIPKNIEIQSKSILRVSNHSTFKNQKGMSTKNSPNLHTIKERGSSMSNFKFGWKKNKIGGNSKKGRSTKKKRYGGNDVKKARSKSKSKKNTWNGIDNYKIFKTIDCYSSKKSNSKGLGSRGNTKEDKRSPKKVKLTKSQTKFGSRIKKGKENFSSNKPQKFVKNFSKRKFSQTVNIKKYVVNPSMGKSKKRKKKKSRSPENIRTLKEYMKKLI